MSKARELVEELNTLPRGYISKKKIAGKEYSYLQYLEGGSLKSSYVRESELDYYNEAIARRKSIEAELDEIVNTGRDAPQLSERARELTGSLMMGGAEVARFGRGELEWIDETRAPLYIVRTHNLSGYLAMRAIDRSRTNSRILKTVMNIHGEPDDIVPLHSHGAPVTDNYWFRTKGSKLKYADVKFANDCYDDVALNGEVLIVGKRSKLTPQLTLTGSYEKCWRLIDGEWWLYKKGSEAELFSECFCARFAEMLGIPTASYEIVNGDIRTRNFADEYNFEPIVAIAGEDDSYDNVYSSLPQSLREDYLRLIWFDTIVNNVDRHNENCGLMRDRETGEIISLAPNYDNNLALVARTTALNMDPSRDGLIKYFKQFLKKNEDARELYRQMELPDVTEEMVRACLESCMEIGKNIGIDAEMLVKYIVGRARYLR